MFGLGKVQLAVAGTALLGLVVTGALAKHYIEKSAELELKLESAQAHIQTLALKNQAASEATTTRDRRVRSLRVELDNNRRQLAKLEAKNEDLREYLDTLVPLAVADSVWLDYDAAAELPSSGTPAGADTGAGAPGDAARRGRQTGLRHAGRGKPGAHAGG